MKKITLILASLVLLGSMSSCTNFLDNKPEGKPNAGDYFKNDYQAIKIVDGIYSKVHQENGFGRQLFWEQAAANDIVWGRTRNFNTLATFKVTGNEGPLSSTYETFTTTIARANYAIDGLLAKQETKTLTPIERRSLGESYFMRAFAHFWIAYRYGTDKQGVPFSRWEDFEDGYNNEVPEQQASVMVNYKLIIEDLDKAVEYLPRFETYDEENRGRAHQAAAVGLKAKVYAYWSTWDATKWSEVIKLVNLLETSYGRGLAANFDQNFSADYKDWWNREYIWTVPSNGGANGGGVELPGVVLDNKGWGLYNGWGQIKPTLDIYEEMLKDGEGNTRLLRSILAYNQEFYYFGEKRNYYGAQDLESGFQINKYMDAFKYKDPTQQGYVNTNGDFPTTRINFPIIRFAELILFRAEAYLMTGNAGNATNDINRIRLRSNLKPLAGTATMTDLYHERRCELAFEYSDHLFDLKRWSRSTNAEIKALALKEINARPRVRIYQDRQNPKSEFKVGYYADYQDKAPYADHMMAFPYPEIVLVNSHGKLKQNPGY